MAKAFPEKVRDARAELGLSQNELGKAIGVSGRMIYAYEQGEKVPRQRTLLKLAKELKVSCRFLTDDECENPLADIEQDGYIAEARDRFGDSAVKDVEKLMEEAVALFAGGSISQSQKDAFFDAVMTAYVTCREEAQKRSIKQTSG